MAFSAEGYNRLQMRKWKMNKVKSSLEKKLPLQKNLWVKQCPDSGKIFSYKGVNVFQP
jgi:hypothetical protein